MEQATAPFFIFQLFCVSLWFLDEMWYYSLFTLFMLVVFESTLVMQRLKNLAEFRAMGVKPYGCLVYREGKWIESSTEGLLPNDIVSVPRSTEETPVSADVVLLQGSCIANEAMLTGESTPQLKEALSVLEQSDLFDIEQHKQCVLFGF